MPTSQRSHAKPIHAPLRKVPVQFAIEKHNPRGIVSMSATDDLGKNGDLSKNIPSFPKNPVNQPLHERASMNSVKNSRAPISKAIFDKNSRMGQIQMNMNPNALIPNKAIEKNRGSDINMINPVIKGETE
jgi:hypothetical protein